MSKLFKKKKRDIFGASLEVGLKRAQENAKWQGDLPPIIQQATEYLMLDNRFEVEGLFRISASRVEMNKHIRLANKRGVLDLRGIEDPHLVACLLKEYLRRLPDPLMTYELYPYWIQAQMGITDPLAKKKYVENLIGRMPYLNRIVLFQLVKFLRKVLSAQSNERGPESFAILFAPNILRSRKDEDDMLNFQPTATLFAELLTNMFGTDFSNARRVAAVGEEWASDEDEYNWDEEEDNEEFDPLAWTDEELMKTMPNPERKSVAEDIRRRTLIGKSKNVNLDQWDSTPVTFGIDEQDGTKKKPINKGPPKNKPRPPAPKPPVDEDESNVLTIKAIFGTDIRRFNVPAGSNLPSVRSRIMESFEDAFDPSFKLSYTDDEGDVCGIGTNRDLRDAVQMALVKKMILRIQVTQARRTTMENRLSTLIGDLRAVAPAVQSICAQETSEDVNSALDPRSSVRMSVRLEAIDAELDSFETLASSLDMATCEECEEVDAELFCDQCEFPYCRPCAELCHAKGALQRHDLTELESTKLNICEECGDQLRDILISPTGETLCEKCATSACARCGKAIDADGSKIVLNDVDIHPECFTCVGCDDSLIGVEWHGTELQSICRPCFVSANSPPCGRCGRTIANGVQTDAGPYHRECILCRVCDADVHTGYFPKGTNIFCLQHRNGA